MIYAENVLNRKHNHEVSVPVDLITDAVSLVVFVGMLIYNFGKAKGLQLAATK